MTSLACGNTGGPLKVGGELDAEIQKTITQRMEAGMAIDRARGAATARGVIKVHKPHTEASILPHITDGWARSMMSRMNLVKRKGEYRIYTSILYCALCLLWTSL